MPKVKVVGPPRTRHLIFSKFENVLNNYAQRLMAIPYTLVVGSIPIPNRFRTH